jgi:hypothetical protein
MVSLMSLVYMRVRETHDGHYVVAICDEDLLGKTLIDGKIEFTVSKEFYGEDLVDVKSCINHLNRATIANMVGAVSVKAAINAGFVHEQAVGYIEGHPHAQWVKL